MDPLLIGVIAFALMIVLILLGIPIYVSIGLVGLGGLMLTYGAGRGLEMAGSVPFSTVFSYTLLVLPMFWLMGNVCAEAGMAGDAFKSGEKLMAGLPGGLAMATVVGSAIIGAPLGSSFAQTAMMTKICMPPMDKHGYDRGLSSGSVAAGATLAGMIPPSGGLVIYSILTEESIGRVLMAGFIPGAIITLLFLAMVYVRCRWLNPSLAPSEEAPVSWKERLFSLRYVWAIALLTFVVMGGIFFGIFPPTAGGSIGALGAFAIALSMRRLTWRSVVSIGVDMTRVMPSLLLILVSGLIFARFLVLSGFVDELLGLVTSLGVSKYLLLLMTFILYLGLGAVMEPVGMRVLTVPMLYPLMVAAGFNGIWFGIYVQIMVEIADITPPIGMNLFVLAATDRSLNLGTVIKGSIPFWLMLMIAVVIIVLFPQTVMLLPNMMVAK